MGQKCFVSSSEIKLLVSRPHCVLTANADMAQAG